MKHFRDLSLRNRIQIWLDLHTKNSDLQLHEKMDGVNITFQFDKGPNTFPVLQYKTSNSPFVSNGEEYLNWANPLGGGRFAEYFAGVIEAFRRDQTLVSKIVSAMIQTKQTTLTAELFSLSIMDTNFHSMKMIRVPYTRPFTDEWDFVEDTAWDHFLFFHDPKMSNFGFQTPRIFRVNPKWELPDANLILGMMDGDSIDDLVSTKKVNKDRRFELNHMITYSVETFINDYIIFRRSMEGIVFVYDRNPVAKVIDPKYMKNQLNSNLFGER